mgnify:CR=1 FL=1
MKKFKRIEKNNFSAQILILKLGLDFGSLYENLVSVLRYHSVLCKGQLETLNVFLHIFGAA